ncbi:MAG: NADH-quinone oxidoreductase subunit H, partial [Alphaproteobacteria bacterium]
MQQFADRLIDTGFLQGLPRGLGYVIVIALFAFLMLNFIMLVAGVTSWLERRVWARIQSRIGPNRVGPQGSIQWLANGL